MKPNWSLMRLVLLAAEDSQKPGRLPIGGFSQAEAGYHCHLLIEAGLARGASVRNQGHSGPSAYIDSLTLPGLEWAELVRDERRWDAALAEAESRGPVTLRSLQELLRQPVAAKPAPSPSAFPRGLGDQGETFLNAHQPKFMYHASKPPVQVFSRKEIEQFGPEWSETYIPQRYPAVKYHWNGENKTVKSAAEEAALGGGWADNPGVFDRYKGPRAPRTDDQDPLKWLEEWSVPGLTSDHRKKIEGQLLRADVAFERSTDKDVGALEGMRKAFDGTAQVLRDAGILTKDLLRKDILDFVWDSAIAGGWWRLASETHQDIFPEQIGHYWIWREDNPAALALFRAEIRLWQAELLDAPTPAPMSSAPSDRQTSEQVVNSDVSGNEKRLRADFLSPGAVNTATDAQSWRDLRIEFETNATDYNELAADFDSLRPGKWELIRAASPRVERIFRDVATKAAAKAALSPTGEGTAPWQLWLDFMWAEGWRRPEKPLAQSGAPRQRRPWHVAKRMAEEGARTLPRVFQTSADCCRDREEREGVSSAADEPSAGRGGPASSPDHAETVEDKPASGNLGVPNMRDEAQSDSKRKRKGDASLLGDKTLVNFQIAEEYLGISERQRQNLIKEGGPLEVKGQGTNRKITTESLLRYLPPENQK